MAAPAPLVGSRPGLGLELPDQRGEDASLGEAQGSRLLVFYPFAFSGICTNEIDALYHLTPALLDAGIEPLAISCDPAHALRGWALARDIDTRLLSDFWPHGEAARAFGVFDDSIGAARRGTFLVRADGQVAWSLVHDTGEQRDMGQVVREVVATA